MVYIGPCLYFYPLPMIYQPPAYDIPMVYRIPAYGILTAYPLYIKPLVYGILNFPTHVRLNPLHMIQSVVLQMFQLVVTD
jgi:hypothetical protein